MVEKKTPAACDGRREGELNWRALDRASSSKLQITVGVVSFSGASARRAWRDAWRDARAWAELGWRP